MNGKQRLTPPTHVTSKFNRFISISEEKKFIPFSQKTNRPTNGRVVKIHRDLFLPFISCVNPNSYEGQFIIRQIESLASTAGQASRPELPTRLAPQASHTLRLQNVNNAFEHMLWAKEVQIYYRVQQSQGEGQPPTVYITGMKKIGQGQDRAPGLYREVSTFSAKKLQKMKDANVSGFGIYINGSGDGLTDALSKAKEKQIGTGGAAKKAVFYNPSSVINELGSWGVPGHSRGTQQAVNELVQVIKQNQVTAEPVSWHVEREGAALLQQALQQIPGTLSSHRFFLVNPVADTPALIRLLTDKKAASNRIDAPLDYYDYQANRVAIIAAASHSADLRRELDRLPGSRKARWRDELMCTLDGIDSMMAPVSVARQQSTQLKRTFVDFVAMSGAKK